MEVHGLDPQSLVAEADRRFVESLPPGPERDTVVASLVRYRAPEALATGDALPEVGVHRAEDLEHVPLSRLVDGRPLLLAFGSFT